MELIIKSNLETNTGIIREQWNLWKLESTWTRPKELSRYEKTNPKLAKEITKNPSNFIEPQKTQEMIPSLTSRSEMKRLKLRTLS